MNRKEHLKRLEQETFDLCIIGAGASGAGCALDAALRGLKVALIEKTDFAAETSSKSTKLIHGGVRYLELAIRKFDFAQLRQVRHGLEERHILLKNAPHLAHPLALLTPVRSFWEGLYFSIGLKIYDFFASKKDRLPKCRWLGKTEMLSRIPHLNPAFHSAVLYFDGQLDDARYCLALAQSAAAAGATVVNHVKVIDFQKDTNGLLVAAQVLEEVQNKQFAVKARYFLNCTGPFSDTIRLMANPALSRRIRYSKGVHLTLPGSLWNSLDALLIPQTKDGRVVFAIPFEGQLILGTTDTAFNVDDAEPVLESTEVAFLLETLQPYLDQAIQPHQITAGFGGVRPLVVATPKEPNTAPSETKSLLRDHIVEHDHVSGLFSLLGGKWTTYRLMAKDAIDAVFRQQKRLAPCSTDHHALVGASGFHQHLWRELAMAAHLPENVARHLASKYGGNAFQIIQILKEDPTLSQVVHPNWPFIEAEICYSVRAEMTCTLRDLMARRWRLEVLDWQAALAVAPLVASRMAKELSWDPTTTQKALNEYQNQLQFWIEQSQK